MIKININTDNNKSFNFVHKKCCQCDFPVFIENDKCTICKKCGSINKTHDDEKLCWDCLFFEFKNKKQKCKNCDNLVVCCSDDGICSNCDENDYNKSKKYSIKSTLR